MRYFFRRGISVVRCFQIIRNMNKLIITLVLLLLQSVSFSQRAACYNPYSVKTDLRFLDTIISIGNYQIVDSISYRSKNIQCMAMAEQYAKKELFTNNKVYLGWSEMENYLNALLMRIAPDSVRVKGNVHVYPARIEHANAFVLGDGSMFFNVGMFETMKSEASVAIVIAHELAHYILGHHQLGTISEKILKKKLNRAIAKSKKLQYAFDYAKYNRLQELQADSLGFILASRAGYDLKYGIDNFLRFQDEEDLAEQRKAVERVKTNESYYGKLSREEVRKLLEKYPDMDVRLQKLEFHIQRLQGQGEGHAFLEDSACFVKLKKSAILEKLNLLLDEDVRRCSRESFICFLSTPEEDDYLYFLLESLRIRLLIFKGEAERPFLTDDFLNDRFAPGKGILHDLSALIPDSLMLLSLPPNELTDAVRFEFETYGEAWQYFSRLALNRTICESYLTLALAETSLTARDSLLALYLSFENCRHREYALALKDHTLYDALSDNNKDLFLFDFPEYYYHSIRDFIAGNENHLSFLTILSSIPTRFTGRPQACFSSELLKNDAGTLFALMRVQHLMQYSRKADTLTTFDPNLMEQKVIVTPKVDPFVIDPSIWEFVEKNKLRSLRSYHSADYGKTSDYFYQYSDLKVSEYFQGLLHNQYKKPSLKLYLDFLLKYLVKAERKYLKKQQKLLAGKR